MKRLKTSPFLLMFLILSGSFLLPPLVTYSQQAGSNQTFLPIIFAPPASPPAPTFRVNIPHFSDEIQSNETAIFWFGRVYDTDNYTDVRVGYTDEFLYVRLAIFDRQIWYDTTPSIQDLTDWDSAALYLNLNGNVGNTVNSNSYAFLGQLAWNEPNMEVAYQGNGGQWQQSGVSFTSTASWVSDGSQINLDGQDRGWTLTYSIPFTSLGYSSAPAPNTVWGMAITLYDRDDESGAIQISDKFWPPAMSSTAPSTWGQLSFGQPFVTSLRPAVQPDGTATIRHGLSGIVVKDGMVGGSSTCGAGLQNLFLSWGEANYAEAHQINIQNQYNLADWPCFSKFYITFPLDSLPSGVQVTSADLTLYHFSNAGNGASGIPTSLIQVMTVGEDWNEDTLTWNNAPLAVENVSQLFVPPYFNNPPAIARVWDVSSAVAEALANGTPLRLVIYSADSGQHSGKYFISSNAGNSSATERPTLTVNWANP